MPCLPELIAYLIMIGAIFNWEIGMKNYLAGLLFQFMFWAGCIGTLPPPTTIDQTKTEIPNELQVEFIMVDECEE